MERGSDARAVPQELGDVGALGGRRPFRRTRPAGELARSHTGVYGHRAVPVENADEAAVPAHLDLFPEQMRRHRIEGAVDLDVAIGMHRACAALEDGERLGGEGLERLLVGLLEVGEDLPPGGAVDAQPRDRAVPVAQMLVLLFERAKTAPLERVALDVPPAAL